MKRLNLIFVLFVLLISSCYFPQKTITVDKQQINKKPFKLETDYYVFENGIYIKNDSITPPHLTGGDDKAFDEWGYGMMKYPEVAKETGIQGTVLITLVINENRNILSSKIKEGIGSGCDEEALKTVVRIYDNLDKPAMLNGVPIKVRFDVPIYFKLTN